jgi:TfoX/Sxy family transcriptional regulator of competence genes
MPMPKADEAVRDQFRSLVPDDSRVTVKPMFGHLAGFVNGNMFTGTFGDQLFVRLDESGRGDLLGIPGATPFEPMPGRPMGEYVVLPPEWREDADLARHWIGRALEWTAQMPVKVPKAGKSRK